jgi:putative flavoprotein involved in K+ transport
MRPETVETVVVGGGQAGLVMSHMLGRRGREHIVLERGRVAERWRSERWDSLVLNNPNWTANLPGLNFPGDPDGFGGRDAVVAFLERYAAHAKVPLRCGVRVTALRPSDRARIRVETDGADYDAQDVIVATGPFQVATVPALAATLPRDIVQITASRYTNPAALPPGATLVVGSGASGCQIVEDLCAAGRRVYFSVGRHRRLPRRYRGKDVATWTNPTALEMLADDSAPADALWRINPLVTGVNGGHDIDIRAYADRGVVLLGRAFDSRDGTLAIAPDLEANLAAGDDSFAAFRDVADAYIRDNGIAAPEEPPLSRRPPPPVATAATGYRCDFRWIRFPIFGATRGLPAHRRGVTSIAGLYFLGLQYLHKRKSAFFQGLEEDAGYLAEQIAG